ncbi:MAG: endonuclease MutS2 [Oscillospiraceae bacterium]
MEIKYLNNLELDKVVAMAVERAVCPETKALLQGETPLTDRTEVRFSLLQTDEMARRLLKNGNPRISSCAGANLAVDRAEKGGLLSMAELLNIAGALRNFSALQSWYKDDDVPEAGQARAMDDLFYSITPQPELEKQIPQAILSPEEMADNASDALYGIRRKIRQTEDAIRSKLDGVIKNPNNSRYLQDALVSIRNGRFVVPVKAEHKAEIGGVIHDVSSSGGTLFVEPTAVVEANAKILQLRNQEAAEVERILGEFTQRVAEAAPLFAPGWHAMLEIDRRLAKAELGLAMDAVMPAVNEEQHFALVKARHPLLDKGKVVPVDIRLGDGYNTLIITGPNTGGKTVSLKTAGLLSAMAQLGYLIPAHDSSAVCVFSEILVDIGDEQSIEQSLSTFSGHMRNITGIFKRVNEKSLVLLDELGAGTDPAEGAALAISIIEKLRESGALVMATTHYAELKMFALETSGVQNAGSEFDLESLRPTYRLMVGVPGRSNAFLIGEKLGLAPEVIENARRHMSSEQRRFETVLTQLEDIKLAMKAQEEELDALRYAAENQLESAREKRDALIRQGEEELAAARQKAKALTDEVQNAAFGLMNEMKRLEKDERVANTQKARRAREIARRDAEALGKRAAAGEAQPQKHHVPLQSAEVGQAVFVPEMGREAVVTAGADKAGLVEVRVGVIKTKLPLGELSALPKAAGRQAGKKQGGTSVSRQGEVGQRSGKTELNLLGKTVDEALMEADQFIDQAVMAGLGTVYLIHGRGTGALRSAITQHLRGNKSVKSYRLGRYGEGEDGVTVVELK